MEMSSNCLFPVVHWICLGSRSGVELKNHTSFSLYPSREERAQRPSILLSLQTLTARPGKQILTLPASPLPPRAAATLCFCLEDVMALLACGNPVMGGLNKTVSGWCVVVFKFCVPVLTGCVSFQGSRLRTEC